VWIFGKDFTVIDVQEGRRLLRKDLVVFIRFVEINYNSFSEHPFAYLLIQSITSRNIAGASGYWLFWRYGRNKCAH
jgi:hypothetical protein